MRGTRNGPEMIDALTRRIDLLRRLRSAPAHKRDLVAELDQSRSTIDRAVRELEEMNLVERGEDGVAATAAGRLAIDHLENFQDGLEAIVTAQNVLDPLPADAPVETGAVVGGEAMLAADPAPYRPLERFHDALAGADRYRAVLPALDDPRHVRLLYEHVVTEGRPAELVVGPEAFETLSEEFPRRMAAMADEEDFRLLVAGTIPQFAVVIAETDDAPPTVAVVVFTDNGAVHGVLINDRPGAVRWARRHLADATTGGTDRTEDLRGCGEPRGQAPGNRAERGLAPPGRSLPVALDRAGFVRLDLSYFREEPVADPTTAWRAGLSLPEVHTGYAVERAPPTGEQGASSPAEDDALGTAVGDRTPADPSGSNMTEALLGGLSKGGDRVVIGPPGSGKSTVCKRVACEWYDDDRGPVFYRESGRGRPLDSGTADALADALATADGHALVVVEDAVRPEANAVFEALDRFEDCDDVSFLLDARENEWTDPPENLEIPAEPGVVNVPPPDDRDVERLVEHFEATVGEAVDIPVDRLQSEIRDGATDATVEPGGVLLLLHRLSTHLDPLSEERTTLEEDAKGVYDDMADDDLALSVCVLANALNAAGLAVHRDALYAVADPDDFGAVDAALDRLAGRVLFEGPDGTYRTVHESWSTAFLAHFVDASDEGTATRVFGDAVTDLLALADHPDRRERIAAYLGGRWTLSAIDDDPGKWVERTVEAIYTLGRKRPKLAPLYGDGGDGTVALPPTAPESLEARRSKWLGRLHVRAGNNDRARRAFENLSLDEGEAVERLVGLARVAIERDRYDRAIELADRAIERIGDGDRPSARARANTVAGRALSARTDYEAATARFRTALDGFESAGDKSQMARVLNELGACEYFRDNYDEALAHFERCLRLFREVGDRQGIANMFSQLGMVASARGEFERSRNCYQRSLEIVREIGDKPGMGRLFNNLGNTEDDLGNLRTAIEHYERALEIMRAIGSPAREAIVLLNLGNTLRVRGDYEQARERLERSIDICEELDRTRPLVNALQNRATVGVRRGNLERARESLERGRDLAAENDLEVARLECLDRLCLVARLRGNLSEAREHGRTALEGAREVDSGYNVVGFNNELGMVQLRNGDLEAARDRFRAALDLAREIDEPHEQAASLTGLGNVARRRGDYELAEDHLSAAIERGESAGNRFRTQVARLATAKLNLARGDLDAGRDDAERCLDAFEEMGTPQWAARTRRLLGRIDAASGSPTDARDRLAEALATFEEIGAYGDAVETLKHLVAVCERVGDPEAVDRWRRRADDLLAEAPGGVVEGFGERIDDEVGRIEPE